MAATADDALLVPEGTRLIHIGPHKTGTTSLQAALWTCREAMLAQGVRRVGRTRNPASAVRAVIGQPSSTSRDTPPSMWHWRDLVGAARRAREPRLVISSEFFAWATPEVIRRVVGDLDPERVRIAVTLRPLARILPSQWQQDVQTGNPTAYDAWLDQLFNSPQGDPRPAFWTLHRHDELVERWAAVVGPERVTVIVVDDRDHAMVLRVFERLLGLRTGTLATEPQLVNRSLTLGEAEAVRAFNLAFKRRGLDKALHAKVMRYGAAAHMKLTAPDPGEPRIETPRWALERTGEVAREMAANIAASGVTVVGDLDSLAVVPGRSPGDDQPAEATLQPALAAAMAMGVLLASGLARRAGSPGANVAPGDLAALSTTQLAIVLVRRLQAMAWRTGGIARDRVLGELRSG